MTSKLPFGGELVQLGDLCELVLGQSPSSESYNTVGKGLPFYQGNADFGKDHPSPKTWCTDPKKVAEPGDILISVRAPIGAINTAVERCCIGRGVAAIRPNADVANPEFLKFQLIAHRTILEAQGTGSTFKAVGKKVLSEHPVTLYPMDVQKELARHFASIISCIGVADAQLSVLSSLVKSRFAEMFGDGDFPRFRLDKVADVQGGLTKNRRRETLPMRLPYLRVANVGPTGGVDTNEMLSIGLTDVEARKTLLKTDDLLFVEGNGSKDQIGRVAIWDGSIDPCVHQNHLIRARLYKDVLPIFALTYFSSPDGRRQITNKAASTSGLFTLSTGKIKSLVLPVPPLSLQHEFSDFAAQVDKSRVVAQKQKEKLQTLYDSLAQEYFAI
ncbi:MAG: hypothetical protein DUD33_09510 [Coriobacteriaceae bacterium]|nr:MAG: hypothetical protein DUD33_09510 [Coriobacteriaceae bacterium]